MRIRLAASLVAATTLGWVGRADAQGTTLVPGANEPVSNVATRGANFLNIGVGARALALGGAAIASADGPSALFWNPANIAAREGLSAFVSHMRLYGNSGISTSAAAITAPIGAGAVGLGVQTFSSGKMERTTEAAPFGGDPSFGGSFTYNGLGVTAQYARNVTDRFIAAIGARYVQEGIDIAKSSYAGFDLSTRFRTGLYGLTIGGSVQNIGSAGSFDGAGVQRAISAPRENGQATGRRLDIEYRTRMIDLPTTFRLGVQSALLGEADALLGASDKHSLMAEASFSDATDAPVQPALGVEYQFRRFAALRAGKRFFNEAAAPWTFSDGLSAGAGLRLPVRGRKMQLDYGFVSMGELQHNQVLSFDVEF